MSMRVTTSMIAGNYSSNLQSLQNTLNVKLNHAYTYRAFDKASDNPLKASEAFQIQWEMDLNSQYQNNLSNETSSAKTADSILVNVEEALSSANSTSMLQGITGTMSQTDRNALAKQIEGYRDSIISEMNSQFADQYLFAGRGSSAPFSVSQDADGNDVILYRGVNVDTGLDSDGNSVDLSNLANEANYVDIGLGMSYDSSGKIVPQSAYNSSMPGISFLGYGTTQETNSEGNSVSVPKNLLSILNQVANDLKNPNLSGQDLMNAVNPLMSSFNSSYDGFLTQQAKVGTNVDFLDDTSSYIQNMSTNLADKDNQVEYVDPANAILDYTQTQYSYNAALQAGTMILQKTLMDFLN